MRNNDNRVIVASDAAKIKQFRQPEPYLILVNEKQQCFKVQPESQPIPKVYIIAMNCSSYIDAKRVLRYVVTKYLNKWRAENG